MESRDSSIDETEDDSSDSSSSGIRGNKRRKLQEANEDRISALPDSLIHHILSFLPSTKQAVKTGILSKRWKNQWAYVPVLIFKSIDPVECDEGLARFIDNILILYHCSKVKKFHISYIFLKDINFTSKIHFATIKNVEELILDCKFSAAYMLPKFLFDNVNLVKLQILNCDFQLSWSINWPSLKALRMDGYCLKESRSIENVLSGCPSLESLEIYSYYRGFPLASNSLKILNFVNVEIVQDVEISCPNLEELYIEGYKPHRHRMGRVSFFLDKTIVNVLSGSPLLRSLELKRCFLHQLVIASKSLKRLYFHGRYESCIEISCSNLEHLNLRGSNIETCKLMNLPSSSCATLDFAIPFRGSGKNLARKVLEGLQQVKELKVGNWFVKILSKLEMGGLSYPLLNLNIKSLTLVWPDFKQISGIVNALRCSPALERLVIELNDYQYQKIADLDLNKFEEICQNSNATVLTCLVSHLKTVKIIGLSKTDGKVKAVLQLVKFLLKNARKLEKMTVILEEFNGTKFQLKVSRKLLSFPRYSKQAIVELL